MALLRRLARSGHKALLPPHASAAFQPTATAGLARNATTGAGGSGGGPPAPTTFSRKSRGPAKSRASRGGSGKPAVGQPGGGAPRRNFWEPEPEGGAAKSKKYVAKVETGQHGAQYTEISQLLAKIKAGDTDNLAASIDDPLLRQAVENRAWASDMSDLYAWLVEEQQHLRAVDKLGDRYSADDARRQILEARRPAGFDERLKAELWFDKTDGTERDRTFAQEGALRASAGINQIESRREEYQHLPGAGFPRFPGEESGALKSEEEEIVEMEREAKHLARTQMRHSLRPEDFDATHVAEKKQPTVSKQHIKYDGRTRPAPNHNRGILALTPDDEHLMYALSLADPKKWTVAALADKFGLDRERTRAILRLKRHAAQQPFRGLSLDPNATKHREQLADEHERATGAAAGTGQSHEEIAAGMRMPSDMAGLDQELARMEKELADLGYASNPKKFSSPSDLPTSVTLSAKKGDTDFMNGMAEMTEVLDKLNADNDKFYDLLKPTEEFTHLNNSIEGGVAALLGATSGLNGGQNIMDASSWDPALLKDEPWLKVALDFGASASAAGSGTNERHAEEVEEYTSVEEFLGSCGLSQFTSLLEQRQVRGATQLAVMDAAGVHALARDLQMDAGEAATFSKAVAELRAQVDEAVETAAGASSEGEGEDAGGSNTAQLEAVLASLSEEIEAGDAEISADDLFKEMGLTTSGDFAEMEAGVMKAALKPLGGIDGHAYKGQFGLNFHDNQYEDKWYGQEDAGLDVDPAADDFESMKEKLLKAADKDQTDFENSSKDDDFYKYFRPAREDFASEDNYEAYLAAESAIESASSTGGGSRRFGGPGQDGGGANAEEVAFHQDVQRQLLDRELHAMQHGGDDTGMSEGFEKEMVRYSRKERDIAAGKRPNSFEELVCKQGKLGLSDHDAANDMDFDPAWRGKNPDHVHFHNQDEDGNTADFMTAGLEDYWNRGTSIGKEGQSVNFFTFFFNFVLLYLYLYLKRHSSMNPT